MKIATVAACPVFGGKVASVDDGRRWRSRACSQVVAPRRRRGRGRRPHGAAKKGLEALEHQLGRGRQRHARRRPTSWRSWSRRAKQQGVVAQQQGDVAAASTGRGQDGRRRLPDAVPRACHHGAAELHRARPRRRLRGVGRLAGRQPSPGRPPPRSPACRSTRSWCTTSSSAAASAGGWRSTTSPRRCASREQVDGPVKVVWTPRGGHPARHLPADLSRPAHRRARCGGHAGELPAPRGRLLDPRSLGAAGVQERSRRRRRRGCRGSLRLPQPPGRLCARASRRPG